MIRKILGLFVNPFTADNKNYLLNRGNLLQHFQMQLSQKQKMFSEYFSPFSEFRFNFEHFQKKYNPHSCCIFGVMVSEKRGYINV